MSIQISQRLSGTHHMTHIMSLGNGKFSDSEFLQWDTRRSLKQSKAFAEDQRKFQLNALQSKEISSNGTHSLILPLCCFQPVFHSFIHCFQPAFHSFINCREYTVQTESEMHIALLLLQTVVQYPLHTLPCSLVLHLRHSPVLQLRCSQSKSIEAKLNFSLAEIDLSDLGGKYLSDLGGNIAVESRLVHRVQLQCNVDELGGIGRKVH